MKKIIVQAVGDLWIEPIRKLIGEGCVEVPYAFSDIIRTDIKERLNKTVFINDILLRSSSKVLRPVWDIKYCIPEFDLINLVKVISSYEPILLQMLNREHQRYKLKYYFEWRNLIIRKTHEIAEFIFSIRPDIIYFSEIPHNFGTYLLYLIAKESKIETLITVMPIETKGRIMVINEFELNYYSFPVQGSDKLTQEANNSDIIDISTKSYKDAEPVYVKHYKKKGKSKFLSFELFERLFERKNLDVSMDSKLLYRFIRRIRTFYTHRLLPKSYENLCTVPDLEKKFVYFALHYQPEQTSLPMAGLFENQYYALVLLSRNLPDDYNIYVKENPFQFINMDTHMINFKNKKYYQELLTIPKIKLVSMHFDSFELIDRSIFTSTLTGMIGWESINRNKPTIVFGYASYRGCEGVISFENERQLKLNIESIINEEVSISISKVRYFYNQVLKSTTRGAIKQQDLEMYSIEFEEHCEGLYTQIRNYILRTLV